MKAEVEYSVEEIIRYRVTRKFKCEGPIGLESGFDCGIGLFERKADAERARDTLEADANRQIRKALFRLACLSLPTGKRSRSRRKKNNKSGYKGVSLIKETGKWGTFIMNDGKNKNLGAYDTAEEAHAAYCVAANKLFGEFARGE